MLRQLFKALRRYLMAGLLIWLPLALTILIFLFLLRFADQALLLVPAEYEEWLPPVPGLGALLAVLILLLTGFLGANLLGSSAGFDGNGGTLRLGLAEGANALQEHIPGIGEVVGNGEYEGVNPVWLGAGVLSCSFFAVGLAWVR